MATLRGALAGLMISFVICLSASPADLVRPQPVITMGQAPVSEAPTSSSPPVAAIVQDSLEKAGQDLRAEFATCAAFFQKGDAAAGKECLLRLHSQATSNVDLLLTGGDMLLRHGFPADALSWLREAAEADPSFRPLFGLALIQYVLKDYENALVTVQRALSLKANDEDARLLEVMVLVNTGETDSAATKLEQATKIFPQSHRWLYAQAEFYRQTKDFQKAKDLLDQCIQTNASMPEYRLRLVNVLNLLGQSKQALEESELAVKLFPRHADAYFTLGSLYERAGRYEEAISCFQQALKLNAQHGEAALHLATLLMRENEFVQAQQVLERLTSHATFAVEASIALGRLYRITGEYAKAEQILRAAISREPKRAQTYYDLAQVLARTGRGDEAKSYLARYEELTRGEKVTRR